MKLLLGYVIFWFGALGVVSAHEMTPTYPKLEVSISQNVLQADLTIFNRRQEVRYYEVGVYDEEFNPIEFATKERILELPYLSRKSFTIYIRSSDKQRATYVCSTSKIERSKQTATIVYSRICSKLK